MKEIPPLRVFVEDDGFLVITRDDNGRWHTLDEDSRMSWTDAEVTEAIPLQPGPSAVVDIRYSPDKGFGDHTLCDVDINGHMGTRRASVFVAGAFIVATAVQRGGPIMVRATPKVNPLTPVQAPAAPSLSIVRDNG